VSRPVTLSEQFHPHPTRHVFGSQLGTPNGDHQAPKKASHPPSTLMPNATRDGQGVRTGPSTATRTVANRPPLVQKRVHIPEARRRLCRESNASALTSQPSRSR
jgi:hypothetical protein